MLESRPLQPPHGRHALPERTSVFLQASRAAGYNTDQVPVAVYTGAPRTNPATGLEQNPCVYCGNCLLGCDVRAKNTLDTNYLALAETRHGATIHPLAVVDGIAPSSGGGYELRFAGWMRLIRAGPGPVIRCTEGSWWLPPGRLDPPDSSSPAVMCRGPCRPSPGRSGSTSRSMASCSSPSHMERRSGRTLGSGLRSPGRATVHTADHLITVEDLGLPDSLLWYLQRVLPPASGRVRALAELAASYARRTLGIGTRTTRLSLEPGLGRFRCPYPADYPLSRYGNGQF